MNHTYDDKVAVTLTLSDWLQVKIALQQAIESYRANDMPYTAMDTDNLHLRIAAQNHEALEAAHRHNVAHVMNWLERTT